MSFEKIIKQAVGSCLSRIEAEHADLVVLAVREAVAKETKHLKEKADRMQAALAAAGKEIERCNTRVSETKASNKLLLAGVNKLCDWIEEHGPVNVEKSKTTKSKILTLGFSLRGKTKKGR